MVTNIVKTNIAQDTKNSILPATAGMR